jgi:hypothetical protein
MPEELSERVTKGLDALSDDSARQVHDYLGKRLGRDQEPDDEEEAGGRVDKICELLEQAGVSPEHIDKVRAVLADDGDLHLVHRGDQDPSGGPSSGYDPMNRSAGAMVGNEPPPFPGAPRAGGGMVPLSSSTSDRRAARDMARFGKIADAAGHISYAKDVPPPRQPKPMAMDSKSRADFLKRFPDAARIGFR